MDRSRTGTGPLRSSPDAAKPEEKEDDAKKSTNYLSTLRSRFPLGGKGDDENGDQDKAKADTSGKKDDAGGGGLGAIGGALGSIRSRIPLGGGASDDDDKADAAQKDAKSGSLAKPAGQRPFGGLRSQPSGNAEVAPAVKEEAKKPLPRFGARGKPAAADPKAEPAKDTDDAGGGGLNLGGRVAALSASLPFGGGKVEKPASKTVRQRNKTPKVEKGEGLSLDRKLDILGVGMVVVSIAIMLSGISPNQGQLTAAINTFFGSALGWGAWAVPVAMFVAGGWLIVRHFGEEPPTVDTERLIGLAIIYLSALVLFQFIKALDYTQIFSFEQLAFETSLTWRDPTQIPSGGGWVGGNLYLLMVQFLGEVLAFSVVIFTVIVGTMMFLDLSVSEIAIVTIGLWRSFRAAQKRSGQRKQVRRAERIAKRQEQLAAINTQPQIEVTTPQADQLPAGASGNRALPAPGTDRAIPITMGGRTVTTSMRGQQQVAVEAPPAPPPQSAPSNQSGKSSGGGLLGGLFGRGSSSNSDNQPRAQAAAPAQLPTLPGQDSTNGSSDSNGGNSGNTAAAAAGGTVLGGLMNRLPFSGDSSSDEGANGQNGGDTAPPTAHGQGPAQQHNANLTPSAHAANLTPGGSPAPTTPAAAGSDHNPFARPAAGQPAMPPQPQTEKSSPFVSSPMGQPAPQPKLESSRVDENTVGGKRISQLMQAVKPDAAAESSDTPAANGDNSAPANGDSPADRTNRLNAIRQGQTGHPSAQQAAPANGAPAPATPPSQGNGSAAPSQPTDAYGNRPTNAPSSGRPDQMKPAPSLLENDPVRNPSLRDWTLPDVGELLNAGSEQDFDRQFLVEQARIIEDTLKSFGAPGRVVEINTGPVITQYGVEPDYLQSRSGKRSRVKVSAIAQLDRDLQLALGARSIRIEAPVPGKGYVGIEIPNAENALVSLKDVMEAEQFQKLLKKSPLAIALGQSVDGTPVSADLASMPHCLIAGTTGSGKSVCINAIICSLLANNTPEQLKLIMVDPKRVELTGYNGIPHLVAPVVVELERIVGVLKWVTREMDERYKRFSSAGARNIVDFNKHLPAGEERMPYIVVIIDELADLMMLAPEETERTITRIAALARATGIHLVIATQRPSVDVVTGLIKANFPARIAFAVAGSVDSRVILDQPGAERLLGRGDMLYLSGDSPAPRRMQGVFVSDDEIDNITRYWRTQAAGAKPAPVKGMAPLSLDPATAPRQVAPATMPGNAPKPIANQPELPMQSGLFEGGFHSDGGGDDNDEPDDEMYNEAVDLVRRLNKASVSLLQRRLRIGYTRASRLIDMMEEQGVVGPQESGSKPREVLPE